MKHIVNLCHECDRPTSFERCGQQASKCPDCGHSYGLIDEGKDPRKALIEWAGQPKEKANG